MQDYQTIKIVTIGDINVGKTSILKRYVNNQFTQTQQCTISSDFVSKTILFQQNIIKIRVWDTAGSQRYRSLSKIFFQGAVGVLVVYDITQPQSYLNVQAWIKQANNHLNLDDTVLMIVGNKIDREDRVVQKKRPIQQFYDKYDIQCHQVSAKTGQNVNEVFTILLKRIYERILRSKNTMSSLYSDGSQIQSLYQSQQKVQISALQCVKEANKSKPFNSNKFIQGKSMRLTLQQHKNQKTLKNYCYC